MQDDINKKYQKAIEELYRAKDFFLEKFCDEDRVKKAKVFITIQSSNKKNNLGHFWADRWDADPSKEKDKEIYHEININAEQMNRPANDIFSTLLHELAHLHNSVLGIEDCNSAQYHNKEFKKTAEKYGLIVDKFPGRGWALTSLSDDGLAAIEAFNPNREALSICRIPAPKIPVENKYITITLKKEDWEEIINEKLEELGMEKPKELIIKLLEEMK
jgi:uncharacterized protein YciU (UPF0263 family)